MRRVTESAWQTTRLVFSLTVAAVALQSCAPAEGGGPTDPPGNQAPTAAAGSDVSVSVGIEVALDGSTSADSDGDALTYAWTLAAPDGSGATLSDAGTVSPTFVPDLEGAFVVSLTVNDGEDDSTADEVTVTATDNTVTGSVPSGSGGSLTSSDGAMTIVVPGGALATDTDISITPLANAQLPQVIRDLPGEPTAYDLRPDGTTFATPAEVTFEVANAVTSSPGRAAMSGVFLVSESGGVIEAMSDVLLAQDETDPAMATASGGIAHFSHAVFMAMSMEFQIDAPDEVSVDEPFDVTYTIDISDAGLDDIVEATVEDVSIAPVAPFEDDGPFESELVAAGEVATITNSYVCSEEGAGRIRANMQFNSSDDFQSVVTIQLGKAVTCVTPPPPIETTFIGDLFRVQRLLPVPGSGSLITSGGAVRKFDLESESVVESLLEGEGDWSEWTSAMADGSYLMHTELGAVQRVVPGADPLRDTIFISPFDQPRHIAMPTENTVAVASAFGDLGLMTFTPAGKFVDAFRDLTVLGGPQQTGTNLQAIWASADLQTFIGASTEGDGDSAFEDTRAVVINADVQSGQFTMTPLPGVIDRLLDPIRRHQFDLECGDHADESGRLVCVFTSGFEDPAFDNPDEDLENDGFVSIFIYDPADGSHDVVLTRAGAARVGGGIFSLAGTTTGTAGPITGVAVVNQFTEEIDVWHVGGTEVVSAFSVSLGGDCANPTDFILIADGSRGAFSCQAETAVPSYGLAVIKNLNWRHAPVS